MGQGLEDYFFWQEITTNPQILAAQANQEALVLKLKNLRIFQDNQDLELTARSALVLAVERTGAGEQDRQKVLFRQHIRKKLPIASLTKLMTGLVVLENYPASQEVQITDRAIAMEGDIGKFKAGEKFLAGELLYSLLVESSNDAAFALSEVIGQEAFVSLMNSTAKNLGLEHSYFVNPSGLDLEVQGKENLEDPQINKAQNYSTARDLAKLTLYLLDKHASLWEILGAGEYKLRRSDGSLHHKVESTNKLLGEIPGIVGGKTGYTDLAKGCFILVLKNTDTYLINVILGSEHKFEEMKKLGGRTND